MNIVFPVSYISSFYLCSLLVLTLFQLCLSNKNLDSVLCIEGERQALLQFKQGLIDEADRLASWVDEDGECCRWAGIVCNNSTGHVQQIRLRGLDGHCLVKNDDSYAHEYENSDQRLKGNLSSSLLHLKQLMHLDLSCNDFGGVQVPSFLGYLENLRYLNLSNSEFGGIIPPQLGNISELHILCLGNFQRNIESTSIVNMQWLSSLRMLHHLDVSGVDLSKSIDWLQVINTLPSLVELHLSSCRLSTIDPNVASLNLTSLSILDLSSNRFGHTRVPQWIFGITSIVSLNLHNCDFDGPIPSSIDSFRNLTSIKFLHVSGNNFINSPLVLKGLFRTVGSHLLLLDIGSCGVSSSVLDSLHNLTSLLSLDVSENHLTKPIPKSMGNICNLEYIDMGVNSFYKFTLTYHLESFFKCKSPRLESLFLDNSKIYGQLPDQIGDLIHLEHLKLQRNHISGTIPDSIGRLSSLRTLKLFENLISGPIPYSIGQLSSLEVLDLYVNRVNGSLPDWIGGLSSLEVLDLSYNQLNGSLPESIGQLSKLVHFAFSYNFLSGVVTEANFAKLGRLVALEGSGNNLILRPRSANWHPPSFHLQFVLLSSWSLGPRFPLWLQLQKDLIQLDISNTTISAPVPESFWRSFPNLQLLDMSCNHIRGTLFDILDLHSNDFTGQLPDLSGSPLEFLDLSDNFFVGSLQHLLCPFSENWINVLNLGNNHLSGIIPECWDKWTSLYILNLENNNLSGGIPKTLGVLSNLETLKMHGNKISGRLPTSLMNLTRLRVLQFRKNELVGGIPKWFGKKLPSLQILNLRSNNFDGNIPHELCYLKHIQILDLADNNLSGNIPKCFNNFHVLSGKENVSIDQFAFSHEAFTRKVLNSDTLVMKGRADTYSTILSLVVILDLSSNSFVGDIPSELTALEALQSLNLSRNQLTGRIPGNIGDMKALVSCDLSMNKLYGELPMSLSSLTLLSSFNVSYNSLTGRVPSSTQLQNLNESSFIGNKLCGAPLTERCTVEVPDTQHQKEDHGSHGADWGLIISIVLGFVSGFWVVFAPLLVSRSWRIIYFHYVHEFGYKVYDAINKYCCNMFSKR